MNKKDVEKLKDLGISILDIKYTYPDEAFLAEVGMWNYEEWNDEVSFSVNGRIESAETARQIEKALLTLVKAKRSKDPRVLEMLEELETLIALTEKQEKK